MNGNFLSIAYIISSGARILISQLRHILMLILSGLNAPNDKSRTLLKQHYKGNLEWH